MVLDLYILFQNLHFSSPKIACLTLLSSSFPCAVLQQQCLWRPLYRRRQIERLDLYILFQNLHFSSPKIACLTLLSSSFSCAVLQLQSLWRPLYRRRQIESRVIFISIQHSCTLSVAPPLASHHCLLNEKNSYWYAKISF